MYIVSAKDAAKTSKRAKVPFDFTADQEDELTLTAGEIVEILHEEKEGGWLKGRSNGKEGLFPCNFVEELPAESTPPMTTPSSADPAAVRGNSTTVNICALIAYLSRKMAIRGIWVYHPLHVYSETPHSRYPQIWTLGFATNTYKCVQINPLNQDTYYGPNGVQSKGVPLYYACRITYINV